MGLNLIQYLNNIALRKFAFKKVKSHNISMIRPLRSKRKIRPHIYSKKSQQNQDKPEPTHEHVRKLFVVQAGPSKSVPDDIVVEDIEDSSLSQVENLTYSRENSDGKEAIDFVTNKIIENINNEEIVFDGIEAIIGYARQNKLFKDGEKVDILTILSLECVNKILKTYTNKSRIIKKMNIYFF